MQEQKEFGFQSREEVLKAAVRDYFEKVIGKWYQYEIRNGKLVLKTEGKEIHSNNPPKNSTVKTPVTTPNNSPITKKPENTPKPIQPAPNKPIPTKQIPNKPLPNKPLSVPSLSGKIPVTDKMMKEFKSLIIDHIRTECNYPLALLKLKNDVCNALEITQGTKPYLGKFAQYIESIIKEQQLFVKIEGPKVCLFLGDSRRTNPQLGTHLRCDFFRLVAISPFF